jgi:hypothetical protein
MKKQLCFVCEDSSVIIGLILGVPTLPICKICRDKTLSFIRATGIPMTTDHPLIAELVEGTQLHGRGFWRYYDSYTTEGEDVFRVVN